MKQVQYDEVRVIENIKGGRGKLLFTLQTDHFRYLQNPCLPDEFLKYAYVYIFIC